MPTVEWKLAEGGLSLLVYTIIITMEWRHNHTGIHQQDTMNTITAKQPDREALVLPMGTLVSITVVHPTSVA